MTKIYCECGTELTILKTTSDDLYSLKHVVERCPNCCPGWIDVEDELPNENDDYVIGWSGCECDLPFECWYSRIGKLPFECWHRGDNKVKVKFWKRYSI